jgi:hypothetical protein
MFKVIAPGFSQEFERWTDALETANSLKPSLKRWTEDIRIFLFDELIWIYSRSHKYPQYIGAGMYDRLARLFVQEAIEAEAGESKKPARNKQVEIKTVGIQ